MNIIRTGNRVEIIDIEHVETKLATGVYQLNYNDMTQSFFLLQKEDFKLPNKVYGDMSVVDRWLKSYKENSSKNLGIALVGVKGSGKTLTAQKLCIDSKMPVILINQNYSGTKFIDFITNPLFNNSIVFLDEFEKIYNTQNDENAQNDFLSLMDGTYQTKLIFLLTMNEEYGLTKYLSNRLSRVKYRKNYEGIDSALMEEIIDDLLVDKSKKDSIFAFFERLGNCTMDILIPLIKEMNLFNEGALEAGKHLNVCMEEVYYTIYEDIKGKLNKCNSSYISLSQEYFDIYRNWQNENKTGKKALLPGCVTVVLQFCKITRISNDEIEIITPEKEKFICKKENKFTSVF